MKRAQAGNYQKKKIIIPSIIGGLAGGFSMYIVMTALMIQIGMGPNCFVIIMGLIIGQPYDKALIPGFVVHFAVSAAVGAIFGFIISSSKKLQVRNYSKGIGLGTAKGVIVFAVLFVPIVMILLPPQMDVLMEMMMIDDMGMEHDMMISNEEMLSMILWVGFFSHIAYGAVLGAIVSKPAKKITQ